MPPLPCAAMALDLGCGDIPSRGWIERCRGFVEEQNLRDH
jgi:hypothetical protein